MYESFYGFLERPFDLTPNPRFLVLTDAHREALSNLEYAVESRKGITLLVGEAGTGKTTIIRTALDRQSARVHSVHLHNPALTRTEFVEMLATKFELSPEARTSKTTLLHELDTLLRKRQAAGESTVLIVDEAQSLPLDLLEEIRLLANIETDDEKLLSLIIAGQPEIAARLNDATLRQLKQRIALRCELHPLTLMESAAYLAGRIRAAGGVGAQVFTREAVTFIHERSGGIPRTISVIADNALLSGFAMAQRPVGTAIVREVCRDFDLLALAERAESAEKPATPPEATSPSKADASRLISFETPPDQAATTSRKAPDAVAARKAEDSESDNSGSMFSSSVPKRRRFSFF